MSQHRNDNPDSPYVIHLLNREGYFLPVSVSNVADLQIEDSLIRWWVSGYIDIKNDFDFLEKSKGKIDDVDNIDPDEPFPENKKTNSTFVFRNDGNDLIVIQFRNPKAKKDTDHTMTYILNVYSVEDVQGTNQHDKVKRLYFYDEKYHRLRNSNLAWSTADLYDPGEFGMAARNAFESGREVSTGDAIKYLLQLALGKNQQFHSSWDSGASTVFYTSPANGKCIDDLDFLMSQHVASNSRGSGRGILIFDRSLRQWRLVSLHDMFSNAATWVAEIEQWVAGPLQQDRYTLTNKPGGSVNEITNNIVDETCAIGGDGVYINQRSDDSSEISQIKFNEMTALDNLNYLLTRPVHLHDNGAKKFHIRQSDNSLSNIYTKLSNLVDKLPHDKTAPTTVSMNIQKDRQSNENISHSYSAGNTADDPGVMNLGINASVFGSVMLSNGVEFVVPGQSWRKSGRFISLSPDTDGGDSKKAAYHNKVHGHYLVLSVVHRLVKDKYTNKLVAIKPYNHRPVHFDPEVNNEPEVSETYNKSLGEYFSQPIE